MAAHALRSRLHFRPQRAYLTQAVRFSSVPLNRTTSSPGLRNRTGFFPRPAAVLSSSAAEWSALVSSRRLFSSSREEDSETEASEETERVKEAPGVVRRPISGSPDASHVYRAATPPKTTQSAALSDISNDLLISLSMAHGNDARSMEGLVNNLRKNGLIQTDRVYQTMLKYDRKDFVSKALAHVAHTDRPQPLGFRATISAPHMHAIALEKLEDRLRPGMKALDIGSGSGYLTACMADMVSPGGQVIALEHVPELVRRSRASVRQVAPELLESQTAKFFAADPFKDQSMLKGTKFDAIHVGAAADTIPQLFLDLLAENGKLVIPVAKMPGSLEQSLLLITRTGTDPEGRPIFTTETLMSVIYSGLYQEPHPEEHDTSETAETEESEEATPQKIARSMKLNEAVSTYAGLAEEFKAWQEEFKAQHDGQRPTLQQMQADEKASQLMKDMALYKEVVLILRHRQMDLENPP